MKNQLFVLTVLVTTISFTTIAYSETIVSLQPKTDITAASVGEQVTIDIKITGGKGVAGYGPLLVPGLGYGPLLVFDSTALKYIGAAHGDYLPTGGVWMSPRLSDDGSYEILLTVGDSTTSGKSVIFPPSAEDSGNDESGDPNDDPPPPGGTHDPGDSAEISIDDLFFQVPEQLLIPSFGLPSGEYWAISLLASSPLGADTKPVPVDGDGTLATLTFEVIEAKPAAITLLEIQLSDTDDAPLESTLQNSLITVDAADAGGRRAADAYSETVVSLQPTTDITAASVGEQVAIDIKITGAKVLQGMDRFLSLIRRHSSTSVQRTGTTFRQAVFG